MTSNFASHLETGRRLLEKMSKSPCEYIEVAFEAEKHALDTTGCDRTSLRSAVQTLDAASDWSDAQREAFVAYIRYLDEHME